MSRWFQPSERHLQGLVNRLDPVEEGVRYGLSSEQARVLWRQVCESAIDAIGRCDHDRAWQQFRARAGARDDRAPDIGKRTRVSFALAGVNHASVAAAALVPRVPGRTSLVAAEVPAPQVLRRAVDGTDAPHRAREVQAALDQLGVGEALPHALRHGVERELGVSLAGARIHTDATAARVARALHAEAFTIGVDIFFAAGRFDPGTRAGAKLIAHELTHVAQAIRGETDSPTNELHVSRPGDPLEREAEAVADRALASTPERAHAPVLSRIFSPPKLARGGMILRAPGDPPKPPKGVAERLGIDLHDLVPVKGSDGHSFKPRTMRAEPPLKEVKLADKIAAELGDEFVFPPTTNQPAIDGFLKRSGVPQQFKTLSGSPEGQPSAVVKHANSAFAKAEGWADVHLHLEAEGATQAEVIARWTQPNRVPALKPMPGDRITRIRVYCKDGVIDLPIPTGAAGANASVAPRTLAKPVVTPTVEPLPKPPSAKAPPVAGDSLGGVAGPRPIVEPSTPEPPASTPATPGTATSELGEVAEVMSRVQRVMRGASRGLAVFFSFKVQVSLGIALELLNALQMIEMAKSKLAGNGFVLTHEIARAKQLEQNTADELSVYRDRYHEDLSRAIHDGMAAAFPRRSQAVLSQLKAAAPEPLSWLRRIEARWTAQRAEIAAVEREARAKQAIVEHMLASQDFYTATAITGTTAAATVFAASQDLSEIAGAAGAAGTQLDAALELVREDIAWLSWLAPASP